jgi:hypothetical protein
MKRMLLLVAAIAATFFALAPGTASADPVGRCPVGFTLTFSPSLEAVLAEQFHIKTNGDEYVCTKDIAGAGDLFIFNDNVVPLFAAT